MLDELEASGRFGAAIRQGMVDATVMKRTAYPEEVAASIAFLASEDASYVTGHAVGVRRSGDDLMKIGLMLQEPFDSLEDLRGRIESAEQDGFASAWLPNTFGVDAITALAVAGTTSTISSSHRAWCRSIRGTHRCLPSRP